MAEAAESEPTPVVGRYEILGKLASGGMAELFIARRSGIEGFQKMVALKRILPAHASDPAFIEMFLDEARLAAQLDHPNVVHVHDIGQAGEHFFFTMEYIHGHTVLALMEAGDGRITVGPAAQIVSRAAAGLHHAHERVGFDGEPLGLVHRDVSPTNVIVSYDGVVKVVDFGVAKSKPREHRTSNGTRKGKTPYMAPEQCEGGVIDRRSDVWALGVMLYEMTTGRRPFSGDTDFVLMKAITEAKPEPPSTVGDAYPQALERIVLRALSREPNARFDTARDMQRALEGFVRAEVPEHTSPDALAEYVVARCGDKPLPWAEASRPLETLEVTRVETPTDALPPTRLHPIEVEPAVTRPAAWRRWAPAVALGLGLLGVGIWASRDSTPKAPKAAQERDAPAAIPKLPADPPVQSSPPAAKPSTAGAAPPPAPAEVPQPVAPTLSEPEAEATAPPEPRPKRSKNHKKRPKPSPKAEKPAPPDEPTLFEIQ